MANDHYVPQCLLRAFATQKKKQFYVSVFDKWTQRSFRTNVSNVLTEKDFNEVMLDEGQKISVEATLSELESMAAPVLEKIRVARKLSSLTTEDKEVLCLFITIQLMRTKKSRNAIQHMNEMFLKGFMRMGIDPNKVENFKPFVDENDLKLMSISAMFDNIGEFSTHISNKVAFLMSAPKGQHFYISDHPVAMSNQNNFLGRGNLGLAVKGIEIYFPISHDLLLALYCSTTANEFLSQWESGQETIKRMKVEALLGVGHLAEIARKTLRNLDDNKGRGEEVITALREGGCVTASTDNVIHCNDLQVRHSARYVVSKTNKFDLVKLILNDYPELKHGLQMQDGSMSSTP